MAGAFTVVQGTLYRASEHAILPDGASLVIIDEINRGPAVQVFGGAIVAIEGEKRLNPDNTPRQDTQYFDLLDPKSKISIEYAFPHHLYILAAMNQADVSVEPLDVAFLRRWAPFSLRPNATILRTHFALGPMADGKLPPQPASTADIYEAAVRAWERVNERIELGRGAEFQVGHGIMMAPAGEAPSKLPDALVHVASVWKAMRAHVDEVFFGDVRGVAAVLNALDTPSGHLYQLTETLFADEPRQRLEGPLVVGPDKIYQLLLAVSGTDDEHATKT
jgi:5-methylcytosine-specific restriction protein B